MTPLLSQPRWPMPEPQRERRWRDKFRDAFRGVKLGIRGQSSFAAHGFAAAMVIAAAIVLECSWIEWCLLLACIGGVVCCELLNSALEILVRGLPAQNRERLRPALDIAAGAVLLASITSLGIGCIIFARHLLPLVF